MFKLILSLHFFLFSPFVLGKEKPFNAVLKKDSVLVNKKDNSRHYVPKDILIRAREQKSGGQYSNILTTSGEEKYYTLTSNLVSVKEDETLAPDIEAMTVYNQEKKVDVFDSDIKTLSFYNYQVSFISTNYFAKIYRGSSKGAVENQFSSKQYFSHQRIPINFGLALNYHRGFWTDSSATVTWDALFVGPSFHTVIWEYGKGAINMQVSALKSISHKSVKDPDTHTFSSNLFTLEITKSRKLNEGSFIFGGAFNYMQSSFKSTTEFLGATGERDSIFGIGVTLGYYHPWIL